MKRYLIEVNPQARKDLEESHLWYQNINPLLGKRFSRAVMIAINSLSEYPTRFQIRFAEIRGISVKGFPYLVLFRIKANKVQIIRVWHTSRNPEDIGS